ncbi:heme oxygenase-like protein [Trichodelitschia bisporula]|uniref:Heme oxygenase-like protein n=1 Tax=Trichodelitschia bisporula TaxID=703511 RepID=A0A6G1I742_9PEZI|nr:heme oxygenase-like protein [Trichodelitschia bisporula]
MGRHANPDIRRAFEEFQDTDSPTKCLRVRCLHCGYQRAKNTTRQIEHLQECRQYLESPDALAYTQQQQQQQQQNGAATNGTQNSTQAPDSSRPAMLQGVHPNPNLQIHRRGPNQGKRPRESIGNAGPNTIANPAAGPPQPQFANPSLTAHLLNMNHAAFNAATQQPFLSHAGCGTLAAAPLSQWMVQDAHYTRGFFQLIGGLIAKIRLPSGVNSQFHPLYRTMDLLISALNNVRREMSFFEITATKYGIQIGDDPPNFHTRAYLDLFNTVTHPSATLLEGMLVLWATEHCYRSAWMYASSFTSTLQGPTTENHIAALHQALIPNWTSPAFSKFVDACRTLVDELANTSTSTNGKEEMLRCEQIFRQVCWLEEQFWPDVDGMGEEDETGRLGVGLSVNGSQAPEPAPFSMNGVGTTSDATAA